MLAATYKYIYVLVFYCILGLSVLQGCQSAQLVTTQEFDEEVTGDKGTGDKTEGYVQEVPSIQELIELKFIVEREVQRPTAHPTPPEPKTLHVMAVGDIMMHMPQVHAGFTGEEYNFDSFFTDVKPYFNEADVVIGNLETTLSGEHLGYSGYPRFNSPNELADALKNAGFDIITTANNHSLDRGEKGIVATIKQLERVGLQHTGTSRTKEEHQQLLLIEQNNIKMAVLAYTYGTNGIPIPSGKDYLVNVLHEGMKEDIKKAKKSGADIVAVSIHFGLEYQRKPSANQIQWVDQLFEWGADLIFGSHPHVVQPYEFREWEDGTGERRQGVVIYSLGNFISNQRTQPRDIGGLFSVKVKKTGEDIDLSEVEFIPTYVHRYRENGKRVYRIIPMGDLLETTAYPQLNESDYTYLEKRYKEMMVHVTSISK